MDDVDICFVLGFGIIGGIELLGAIMTFQESRFWSGIALMIGAASFLTMAAVVVSSSRELRPADSKDETTINLTKEV